MFDCNIVLGVVKVGDGVTLTCTSCVEAVVKSVELGDVLNGFSDSKAFGFLVSIEVVMLGVAISLAFSPFLSCTVLTSNGSFVAAELVDPKLTNGEWDNEDAFAGKG